MKSISSGEIRDLARLLCARGMLKYTGEEDKYPLISSEIVKTSKDERYSKCKSKVKTKVDNVIHLVTSITEDMKLNLDLLAIYIIYLVLSPNERDTNLSPKLTELSGTLSKALDEAMDTFSEELAEDITSDTWRLAIKIMEESK
ncbi:MAG: hypothetical protein KGV43_02895 [Arcobacter sp.]|nr:hypothetical protein [Arcobacter sp.]